MLGPYIGTPLGHLNFNKWEIKGRECSTDMSKPVIPKKHEINLKRVKKTKTNTRKCYFWRVKDEKFGLILV